MVAFFEFLALLMRKLDSMFSYIFERVLVNFQALSTTHQIVLIVFLIIDLFIVWYIITIILRLFFKREIDKLENVGYDYLITLNRAKGKRCSFLHEILYYQRIEIIDEEIKYDPNKASKKVAKKKKKKSKIKLLRKKDTVRTQVLPLLDPADDIYVVDFIGLNRRMLSSTFFILLTFSTLLFSRYRDFDVIFRGLFMLRFEDYVWSENLGSWLFIVGFFVAILLTLFIWIYFYTRGSWQDKLNLRLIYESFDIITIIPTFVAVLTVINAFVISPATVSQTSMEPNYYEGDSVFILHNANYQRHDVVIVLATEAEYNDYTGLYSMNEYYIKRVIGLPGDTVEIYDGFVYVNGNLIEEDYLKPNTDTYCIHGTTIDESEQCMFVVPEGEYFLLGDNRVNSYDSRAIGTFKKDQLYGKVVFKVG